MLARVGKPAPDFEANAFVGAGFKPIKLSDYKGKWVGVYDEDAGVDIRGRFIIDPDFVIR